MKPVPLVMVPGHCAILFPNDGHVPAVSDGINNRCQMVVFKVRMSVSEKTVSSGLP